MGQAPEAETNRRITALLTRAAAAALLVGLPAVVLPAPAPRRPAALPALPRTGTEPQPLAGAAALLSGAGAALVAAGRRRRSGPSPGR